MLTARQAELHRFIFEFTRRRGWSPTFREMANALEISTGNIHRLTVGLEERGYLKRIPHCGITLLKRPPLHHTKYFKAVYYDEPYRKPMQVLVPLEVI